MIDILLPTRGRPHRVLDFIDSVLDTAKDKSNIHIILNFDSGDIDSLREVIDYESWDKELVSYIVTESDVLSKLWNECFNLGTGDIVMQCSDDILFESVGWDNVVRDYFKENPIGLIYGQDGHQDENCATHSFTSRKAANILGYFCPPYFEADFNDVWLQQMYHDLGKIKYDDRIITRHYHVNVDSKYNDDTYEIAVERRKRAALVWEEKKHEIDSGVALLKEAL